MLLLLLVFSPYSLRFLPLLIFWCFKRDSWSARESSIDCLCLQAKFCLHENRTWNSIHEEEHDDKTMSREYFVLGSQSLTTTRRDTKTGNMVFFFSWNSFSLLELHHDSQVPSLHLFLETLCSHFKLTIPGITSREPKEKHIPISLQCVLFRENVERDRLFIQRETVSLMSIWSKKNIASAKETKFLWLPPSLRLPVHELITGIASDNFLWTRQSSRHRTGIDQTK